jgi:GTPase KRas
MRSLYMKHSHGFVIVYSVTSRRSMDEAIEIYEQITREKDSDHFPVILVANKCDLVHQRVVSRSDGQLLAKALGCKYIESSAKLRDNIDRIFYELVLIIIDNEKPPVCPTEKSKMRKSLCVLL